MTREKGLVSIWSLGQFPAGAADLHHRAVQSRRRGSSWDRSSTRDYFGRIPPDRLRVSAEAHLVPGRRQVPLEDRRAATARQAGGRLDRLAARRADARAFLDAAGSRPAFSYVEQHLGSAAGAVTAATSFNSYNDGPPEPGKPALGGFYEIESLSPAAQLPTGKSLTHTQTTFHIEGDAVVAGARGQGGPGGRRQGRRNRQRKIEAMNLAPIRSLLVRVLEPEVMDSRRGRPRLRRDGPRRGEPALRGRFSGGPAQAGGAATRCCSKCSTWAPAPRRFRIELCAQNPRARVVAIDLAEHMLRAGARKRRACRARIDGFRSSGSTPSGCRLPTAGLPP